MSHALSSPGHLRQRWVRVASSFLMWGLACDASTSSSPQPQADAGGQDGGTVDTRSDGAGPNCTESLSPQLVCSGGDLPCTSSKPCPSSFSEAPTTCPLDASVTLASVCGLNTWSLSSIASGVTCFYDATTGALQTINEFNLANPYCSGHSGQMWFGPQPQNCDLSSPGDVRRIACPRTAPPPPCPPDLVPGAHCGFSYNTECTLRTDFSCRCAPIPPADDFVWRCGS